MASSGLQVRTGAATSVTPCRDAARGWRLTAAGLYGATCGLTCGAAAEANTPPVRGTRLVPASWLQWPATMPWGLGHGTAPASCWGEPELRVPRLKPGVAGPRPWRLPGRCFLPRPWARRHTPPSWGAVTRHLPGPSTHDSIWGPRNTPASPLCGDPQLSHTCKGPSAKCRHVRDFRGGDRTPWVLAFCLQGGGFSHPLPSRGVKSYFWLSAAISESRKLPGRDLPAHSSVRVTGG